MKLKPLTRRELIIHRLLAADAAKTNLLDYTAYTMPDFTNVDDVRLTRYQGAKLHKTLAQVLEDIAEGKKLRVIINCPPRHGKTELASKRFIAWLMGRFPEKSLIFGTYNQTFADDVGRAVRDIATSPQHRQVFPEFGLKEGSAAVDRLETTKDGVISFVGRGGTATGRGGHGLIIDDPLKDRAEADSQLIRDKLWEWFTQVIATRQMTDDSFMMVIQTRWHEDDLVGRLTDPSNPFYDPEEAKLWTVIDLPALAADNDPLGRKPGEALWPERFPVDFLKAQQRLDPRGFQALYQGRPTSETGAFFQAEFIKTYQPNELPRNLRFYVASDHAVSVRQDRDKTCLIPVGVDENDNIYVLPDVWWRHGAADTVVEAMINLMAERKPIYWWAERGHISKAIGPFLRKRMAEEGVYASLVEVTPVADKQTRAQSILGRMAMGKVYFPAFATWWPEARDQLLKFPHGAHDDFVDALAYIGMGLAQQVSAARVRTTRTARAGSFAALFSQTRKHDRAAKAARQAQDW